MQLLLTLFILMKDFSFFFLKNLMSSKIGRGFRNVCSDDTSTSTLNQKQPSSSYTTPSSHEQPSSSSCMENDDNFINLNNAPPRKSVTLEEMILQLELEEAKARREKSGHNNEEMNVPPRRMSCVNNSDILRSARNALNQYPRFSLDGRDAMYRSSFRKTNNNSFLGTRSAMDGLKLGRILHLPHSVGGESVIWCKPGVVPTLMGLEAMPLPISKLYNNKNSSNTHAKEKLSNNNTNANYFRNQNLKRLEKNKMDRRHQQMRHGRRNSNVCCGDVTRFGRGGGGGGGGGRCSTSSGYCAMNQIGVEPVYGLGGLVSRPSSYSCT